MEVHNAGGGINFTVDHTRNATEEKLYELLEERLMRMLRAGSIFTIYQFFLFSSYGQCSIIVLRLVKA
jgi:hypothetical protein